MYDIEHKPEQEEPAFTPEQKDITTAGRPKLPRAWRYAIIGGTALLVQGHQLSRHLRSEQQLSLHLPQSQSQRQYCRITM
jgi:primosomal replication protein N